MMLKGSRKKVERAGRPCIYISRAKREGEQKSELKKSLGRFLERLTRRNGETSKGGEFVSLSSLHPELEPTRSTNFSTDRP